MTEGAANKEAEVVQLKARIAMLDAKLLSAERVRRKLHNDVQELRGNIRVYCRIRPVLNNEHASQMEVIPSDTEQEQLILQTFTDDIVSGASVAKPVSFAFDRVFGPNADQMAVFEEISQLVQSSLDGYRVCIFAYGQTGSGKTFTMEGDAQSTPSSAGMIPRAVEQLFLYASTLSRDRGWTFDFSLSFLEIYNESIRDLLSDAAPPKPHEIRHSGLETTVTDLSIHSVNSQAQVMSLLARASKNRSIGETQCNERSSRSHRYPTITRTLCHLRCISFTLLLVIGL